MELQIQLNDIAEELKAVKSMIQKLLGAKPEREWYTTEEVAKILNRSPYTIREYCRNSRINSTKRATGRGRSHDWGISHGEVKRIQNEGLLPLRNSNK